MGSVLPVAGRCWLWEREVEREQQVQQRWTEGSMTPKRASPARSPSGWLYLVAEERNIGTGVAPLFEVDGPAAATPQGTVVEDLIGTAGAIEDEDGDEGKEDHEHC